jgi:hypothetical protein
MRHARALLYQFAGELLRDHVKVEDGEETIFDDALGAQFSIVVRRIVKGSDKPIRVKGTHRRIISVLDYSTPKTQFQIYIKLGKYRPEKAMSGGFRTCCADLVRWGVSKHVDGGYILRTDVPADVLKHFNGILPKS